MLETFTARNTALFARILILLRLISLSWVIVQNLWLIKGQMDFLADEDDNLFIQNVPYLVYVKVEGCPHIAISFALTKHFYCPLDTARIQLIHSLPAQILLQKLRSNLYHIIES